MHEDINLLPFCAVFHCRSLHTLYICSPASRHVGCLQVAVWEALLLRARLYTDTRARHSLEFLPTRGTSESPSAFQDGAKWISKAIVPTYSPGSKGWVLSLLAHASRGFYPWAEATNWSQTKLSLFSAWHHLPAGLSIWCVCVVELWLKECD